MSLKEELHAKFNGVPEVKKITVDKDLEYHGESAVGVEVFLHGGKVVSGVFTTNVKGLPSGYGGNLKDVPALMHAKVQSVLKGRAE